MKCNVNLKIMWLLEANSFSPSILATFSNGVHTHTQIHPAKQLTAVLHSTGSYSIVTGC